MKPTINQIIDKELNEFQIDLQKKGYKMYTFAWTYNSYEFCMGLEKKYNIKIYARFFDEWKKTKRIDCVFRLLIVKLLYPLLNNE